MIFYFTMVTCSTPESSRRLSKNGIASSLTTIIGGIILVVLSFALAGGTRVLEVASYPVGPAVADRGTIDEGLAHSWWAWWACARSPITGGAGGTGGSVGRRVGGKGLSYHAAYLVDSDARVGADGWGRRWFFIRWILEEGG